MSPEIQTQIEKIVADIEKMRRRARMRRLAWRVVLVILFAIAAFKAGVFWAALQ